MADGAPGGESKRLRLERRLTALKTERASFEAHWRMLAENFMPRRGRFTLSDTNRGDRRHQQIIDGAPIKSVRTMQAGLMSGLTSPARPWFRLTTPDPNLTEFASVKNWLHVVDQRMRTMFARTNLYTSLSEMYGELGTFGTMAMLQLPDQRKVVRYMPFTVGQYWLSQDYTGRVDTLCREIRQTVRQVVDEFGLDACSSRVKNDYQRGNLENFVDVMHCIGPNHERDASREDAMGMPFYSSYYEIGAKQEGADLLAERGFRMNPILSARWSQVAGDTYGTSCPGMDALGDARALQLNQRRKAQAIDKWVDPPMQAPASLQNSPVSGLPGGVTYYDATHQGSGVRPLYDVKPDIQYLLQDMGETRDRVNGYFYADLFLMLSNLSNTTQRTAAEIAERHEEKLLALGPVLERLNTETFDPLIDAAFDRGVELSEPFWSGKMQGEPFFPEPPAELHGVPLRVEYISVLAQAQKMVGIGAVQQLFGFVSQIAAVKRDALDKLDVDQAIDEMGEMLGVSPRIVLSDDAVAEIRDQRAQQQQAQQQAAMLTQAASVAKDAGNASTAPDTLMGKVLQMSGAQT